MPKIFCIGFQKSGTTSLEKAFRLLGYKVCGVTHELIPELQKKNFDALNRIVVQYDVFRDNPWPVIYKELDARFPGSKFILTVRDEAAWIKSVVNHFDHTPSKMLEFVYGVPYPAGNEELFLLTYRNHNADVQAYFKERPNDLLVIDLEEGNNWEKICSFLNIPVPGVAFPHENKGAYTKVGKVKKYFWKRIRARWRNLFTRK